MRSSFLMGLRLAVLLGSLLLFTWAAVGGQGLSFVVVWLDGVGLASLGNALSPTVSAEEQGDKGARKPVLATNAVAAPDPSRPALWLDGPPAPPAPVAVTNPNAPVVLTPIGESVAPPASAPWAQSFAPQQEYAPPTQPASVAPPTHPGFVNPRLANPAAPPQFRSSQLSPSGSASPADRRFGAAPESPEIVTAAGGGSAPTVTPVGYFGESEPTVPLSRAAGRPETGAPPPVVDPAAVRST
ncbi:MAG TPA: hypothetical protein VGE52_14070, partial [Pirellulales bacterium]